jgi:hypothetical protein
MVIFALIVSIGVGIELSKTIEDTVVYLLFWILYIITIVTFIGILVTINFYLTMKSKEGPPGLQGEHGDRGDPGPVGKCDPGCKDDICNRAVLDSVMNKLQELNRGQQVTLNNVYIKGKIKQMCSSEEFKQLAPYNGPVNLMNYLKTIWNNWITAIYEAGGNNFVYFETIGAENEWEWVKNNPFDDIKKYDIFYWGMGPEYRPQLIDKCYNTDENGNITGNAITELKVSTTDLYDFIANDDGIGAYDRASFWRPKQFTYNSITYYPVGDIAIGPYRDNESIKIKRHIGAIKLPEKSPGPNRETILIAGDVLGPIDYKLIWTNSGTKGTQIWVWRPIGPATSDGDYLALGDVVTTNPMPPDTGDNAPIRCVPKSMLTQILAPGKKLWTSSGSDVSTNLNIVGYTRNLDKSNAYPSNNLDQTELDSSVYKNATHDNAYNLFRAVLGGSTNIPASDTNGSFYKINKPLDIADMPGADAGTPPNSSTANMKGKGYLSSPTKDAKYSVLSYLNMKNKAGLKHVKTQTPVEINLVQDTTGVLYTVHINNKCLKEQNGTIILAQCDSMQEKQIFILEFTGNSHSQCRLKTGKTPNMYLILDESNNFRLVNTISNKDTSNDLSLFIME